MANSNVWKKITNQRTEILEYLQTTKDHPTASKIYIEIKNKLPRISLSTVYRTLEELQRQNLVRAIYLGKEILYETNFQDHLDFYCISCRRVFDIPAVEIIDIKRRLENSDYKTEENQFIIKGICPVCQKLGHK